MDTHSPLFLSFDDLSFVVLIPRPDRAEGGGSLCRAQGSGGHAMREGRHAQQKARSRAMPQAAIGRASVSRLSHFKLRARRVQRLGYRPVAVPRVTVRGLRRCVR